MNDSGGKNSCLIMLILNSAMIALIIGGASVAVSGAVAPGIMMIVSAFILMGITIFYMIKNKGKSAGPGSAPKSNIDDEYNPYAPPKKPEGGEPYDPWRTRGNTYNPYDPRPPQGREAPQSLADALKAREEALRKERERAAKLRAEQLKRIEEAGAEAGAHYKKPDTDEIMEDAYAAFKKASVWLPEEPREEKSAAPKVYAAPAAEKRDNAIASHPPAQRVINGEGNNIGGTQNNAQAAQSPRRPDSAQPAQQEKQLTTQEKQLAELEFEAVTERENLAILQGSGAMETARVAAVTDVSENYCRITFKLQTFEGVEEKYAIARKDQKYTPDSAHYILLDKRDKERCTVL